MPLGVTVSIGAQNFPLAGTSVRRLSVTEQVIHKGAGRITTGGVLTPMARLYPVKALVATGLWETKGPDQSLWDRF